jgi:hypothetical protein
MSDRIFDGCLCGKVRHSIPDNFLYSGYCHCSECYRAIGSAFMTFGGLLSEDLVIDQGKEVLGKFAKSEESFGYFCQGCGSSVFAEKPKHDIISISLGSLDSAPSVQSRFLIHTASKAQWYEISDNLRQYVHDLERCPVLPTST